LIRGLGEKIRDALRDFWADLGDFFQLFYRGFSEFRSEANERQGAGRYAPQRNESPARKSNARGCYSCWP